MKALVLLLWLALFGGGIARAADAQGAYEAGVAAARAGDPEAAVEQLVESLDAGGRHPAVYHALGNALYRAGDLGRAVAAWRRAAVLAPRDGDIQANLERARRESADRLEAAGGGVFFWQRILSPAEGALLAGALAALGLAAAAARTWRSRRAGPARRVGAETAVLLLLSVLLWISTLSARGGEGGAIVVAPEATARSALGPGGVDLFVLHAGAEVAVMEQAGAHTLVALPDERKGWLPTTALLSADPSAPFSMPSP